MQGMLGLPVGGVSRRRRGRQERGTGAQNRYRCLTPRPVHAYSLYRICCYWFHSASGFMQMLPLPLPLPLATTSLVGLNIFLCFASFLSFSFFCFVTAAAFPCFWRSMSESFPWAAAAASQVHVMLLHSCERALLLLQQSRAFMPLAFWMLDRITIILLDLKVTFRKWVEWVRKRRHQQRDETNKQTARLLSRKWSNLALSLLLRFQQSH